MMFLLLRKEGTWTLLAGREETTVARPEILFSLAAMAEIAKMKFNPCVTSAFNMPSHIYRKIMSSPISKELRQKDNSQSLTIQKDNEVQVKINQWQSSLGLQKEICYLLRTYFFLGEQANTTTVHMVISSATWLSITRLKLNEDHQKSLEWKAKSHPLGKETSKYK